MNQETALEIMKTGSNVFLTGAAGSGKTYTLEKYLRILDKEGISYAVTAPTGIAASHLGGTTVHSFFGLGIKETLSDYDLDALTERKYLWDRLQKLKVLVIDEVSMLSPEIFSSIDRVLKTFLQSSQPYGGIQVILSGDFFQLPPVRKQRGSELRFVFQTDLWNELDLVPCYLAGSQRHRDDDTLLSILNEIRSGNVSEESMEHFRSRYKKKTVSQQVTKLYTHNKDVDSINDATLSELDTPMLVFHAETKGPKKWVEQIINNSLLVSELRLKKGALVFFIKNNYERGYINGTLGTVVDTSVQGYPIVETHDGQTITASPEAWIKEDDGKELASVIQVPLRLAWAITIHKSQGMTLDAAEIDLSSAFEPGQGYVALSRIKHLQGLTLMGLNDTALCADPQVCEQDHLFQEQSQAYARRFAEMDAKEKEERFSTFMKNVGGDTSHSSTTSSNVGISSTTKATKELLEQGLTIEEIAQKRDLTESTIINHIYNIIRDDRDIDISHIQPSISIIEAVEKAVNEISKKESLQKEDIPLKTIFVSAGEDISYEDIRCALLFLE
jgi:hypothetical protein